MKRVLSLLLVFVMLFSSCALLFSCSDKPEEVKKGDGEKKQLVDDGSIFYERSLVKDDLPDVNYGGREFRVVAHMPGEVFVKEEDRNKGDLIKDAHFARTNAVENRFGVKVSIAYTGTYSEVSSYVSKTVLSGSDEFDLLMGMAVDTGGLVTKKLFLNWHEIENIDFDKPWWSKSTVEELTYNGKCPIAVSDLNFSSITSTYCMIFNKSLAASYELGNIYDIVLDGKWTIDKLHEMVKDLYVDDGNDTRDDNDFYGIYHDHGSCVNTYLWSFDNPVCKKDEEGVPQVAIKTDKIDTIVTKLYDMFYNTAGVYYDIDYNNEKGISKTRFYEKKSVFAIATLSTPTGEKLRNFEDDYGIIPYPKYDENQAEYKTMADGYHSVLAVPKTVKDTEFVGTIVEALSAETWKTVTPTLYEIALKTRYLRDSESKEVLDLIIDGRTFDFGFIYDGWQGFSFALSQIFGAGNSNFQSYYDKRYKQARLQYTTVVKALDKI
ncbi:MAG: hypothetical protein IJP16_08920 [Clostridia bacterium]|nr:hypothetical protein [Clostridia bacterium]